MTRVEQAIASINQEYQAKVLKSWHGYERELLIEVVRALDHVAFAFELAPNREELRAQDTARQLMKLGAATALSPLLKALANSPGGVPWGPSTEQLAALADTHLLNCGRLAHIRRMAELERYGLATSTFVRDDHVIIDVTADVAEVADREAEVWLRAWRNKPHTAEDASLIEKKDYIASRLDTYIDVADGWFIRYGGDPESQEYHRALAISASRGIPEGESLPVDAVLGGRPFRSWNEASTRASGRVLHHVACATRLMATKPGLELRNLLTVFARKEDIVSVWRESGEELEVINSLVPLLTHYCVMNKQAVKEGPACSLGL